MSGGSIEAEGLVGGAGIGGGNGCDSGSIQISGNAVIVAKGHEGGAGIGGGNDGNSESITITGGTIRAQGGANAAGIGGGNGSGDDSSGGGSGGSGGSSGGSGSGGSITIGGSSEVIAIAGVRGAGIGGGNNGAAAIVVLEAPAKVIAYASDPDYNPAISAANYTNLGGSGLVNVAFYAGYNPTLSLAVVTITQADGTELLLVPPINYRCLAYTSVSGVNLLTTISSSVTQAFVYDGNDPETGSVSILSSTALMPVRGVTLATALTISFNTDTSSSLPDSICVAGSTVTLPTGAGLSKPGYTLDKWGTSPSGGTLFDPGQVVAVDSLLFGDDNRLMLYGLWRMNTIYRVTYDGNGATSGEVPIDLNDSYSPGDLVTVLGEGSLIRAGYTFAGWALNASGAIVYQTGDQFEISRDMVLFAVWSQIDDPTGPTKRPTSPVTPATGDWSPLVLPLLVLGSVMLGVGLALRRKNRRLVD
ncbi:MAG: InlB B-repeat-containing protein [Coriobacteriales bacterium]|nr:InlB B-repeat-containing protein [Coriobacteriales bacterium]